MRRRPRLQARTGRERFRRWIHQAVVPVALRRSSATAAAQALRRADGPPWAVAVWPASRGAAGDSGTGGGGIRRSTLASGSALRARCPAHARPERDRGVQRDRQREGRDETRSRRASDTPELAPDVGSRSATPAGRWKEPAGARGGITSGEGTGCREGTRLGRRTGSVDDEPSVAEAEPQPVAIRRADCTTHARRGRPRRPPSWTVTAPCDDWTMVERRSDEVHCAPVNARTASARRMRVENRGTRGSSDGWMLSIRPSKRETRSAPGSA